MATWAQLLRLLCELRRDDPQLRDAVEVPAVQCRDAEAMRKRRRADPQVVRVHGGARHRELSPDRGVPPGDCNREPNGVVRTENATDLARVPGAPNGFRTLRARVFFGGSYKSRRCHGATLNGDSAPEPSVDKLRQRGRQLLKPTFLGVVRPKANFALPVAEADSVYARAADLEKGLVLQDFITFHGFNDPRIALFVPKSVAPFFRDSALGSGRKPIQVKHRSSAP